MDNTTNTETIRSLTESIKNLIDKIGKEIVVLPEFQRDFVWDLGKTYDLFDSLVKDIFIGSIIYGIPSFEITVRELDKRPRKSPGSRRKSLKVSSYSKEQIDSLIKIGNFRLILDGQQRVTSIYRALKGDDDVWFISKNKEELANGVNYDSLSLEELLYEFTGKEDENRLSLKLSDIYKMMETSFFEKEIKEGFYNKLRFPNEKDEEFKETNFRIYLIVSRKLQDLFKAEKLLSYYLLNTGSEKFALFFERSNSRGVQLNFIDILAAKLYVGFNLRDKIAEFEDNNPNYLLNREIIVRSISYIISQGRDIDKSYILSSLTYGHFDKHWTEICNLYKNLLDFLYKNHFVISQSWMPYENMLLPLMMFLRELGGDFSQMNDKQFFFIKYWYWSSIFSQRYTGASNTVIISDTKTLELIAKNKKITDRGYFSKLKVPMESYDEIYNLSKKGTALYDGVLNLINYDAEGLPDWKNSSKLSFNSKLEDHHIFPKEYIKTEFSNDEEVLGLIDSVVNRTLIPKITNIKIGKKPPSKYLQELLTNNQNLKQSLDLHLINEDVLEGYYDTEYKEFIKDRAKKIFELIEKHVFRIRERIIKEFYQEL